MISRVTLTAVAFSIGACSLALPTRAMADELHTYAEVVCRTGTNAALVRFTTAWNSDAPVYRRLPQAVDLGLSAAPASRRQDCAMANGWKIRVRSGDKQAFAYGMGGADPPAFFSLWVAGRKVMSRNEWKPGYASTTDPWTVAVVIRPDRLTTCRVVDGKDAPHMGAPTCSDASLRLDRYKVDEIEYAKRGTRPPVGTMLVLPGSPNPKVCREYLRVRRNNWPEAYGMVDSAKIFGPRLATPLPYSIAEGLIVLGPGVRRKLVHWSAQAGYFDGDLIFIAPGSADPRTELKPDMLDDGDHFPAGKLPEGWRVISGDQPGLYPDVTWRYVHFDTQKIDGRLYLLAQPSNREHRPTAILLQPNTTGFRSICQFQRVEPNF